MHKLRWNAKTELRKDSKTILQTFIKQGLFIYGYENLLWKNSLYTLFSPVLSRNNVSRRVTTDVSTPTSDLRDLSYVFTKESTTQKEELLSFLLIKLVFSTRWTKPTPEQDRWQQPVLSPVSPREESIISTATGLKLITIHVFLSFRTTHAAEYGH